MSSTAPNQSELREAHPRTLAAHRREKEEEHEYPEAVPWSELRPEFMEGFEPGEHTAVIGPTGEGKTTFTLDMVRGLYERGAYVAVFANKPNDPVLTDLMKEGWPRIKRWPPTYDQRTKRRVILWPDYGRASRAVDNKGHFVFALDSILAEGQWVVLINEMRYFVEQMGLRTMMDELLNEARSSNVTMIMESQGTTWVTRAMIEQETWLVAFRPRHEEAQEEVSKVAGSKVYMLDLDRLGHHEFMIVNLKTGDRYVSKIGT